MDIFWWRRRHVHIDLLHVTPYDRGHPSVVSTVIWWHLEQIYVHVTPTSSKDLHDLSGNLFQRDYSFYANQNPHLIANCHETLEMCAVNKTHQGYQLLFLIGPYLTKLLKKPVYDVCFV